MFADGMCDICMHEKAVCFAVPGVNGNTGHFDLCISCYNKIVKMNEEDVRREYDERQRAIDCLSHPLKCLLNGTYKICKDNICSREMKVWAVKSGYA